MPNNIVLTDRSVYADDSNPAVIITQAGTGANLDLRHDTQPELRLKEGDQTAPAGMFRMIINGDELIFQRAAAADWSSSTDILTITATGGINIGSIAMDDDEAITFGGVASLLYETADPNANELILALPNGGATDVPVFVIGDQSILNTNLGNHNGLVEPTVAIYNAAGNAYVSIDAGDINGSTAGIGIYFKAATDEDINILKLSVTGTPTIIWDESYDAFSFSHGIELANGVYIHSASTVYSYIEHDAGAWDIFTKTSGNAAVSRLRIPTGTDTVTIAMANSNLLFGHNMAIQTNAATGTVLNFQAYEGSAYVTLASLNSGATTASWQFGARTVYINDSANTNMTVGLTINQEANDDNLIEGKSSDVSHALAAVSETDTYFFIKKRTADGGGLHLGALSDSDHMTNPTLLFASYSNTAADTTKSTSGKGIIELISYGHDNAGSLSNITANGNVVVIRAQVSGGINTLFIFDSDGDLWLKGGITTGAVTPDADYPNYFSTSARTLNANQSGAHAYINPGGAVTVPAGTAPYVATLHIKEPNISATGAATIAATLIIEDAPTEGGTNAAIYVGAGDIILASAGATALSIARDNSTEIKVATNHNTAGNSPHLTFQRGLNTAASPAVVVNNTEIGVISFKGYDGSGYDEAAMIVCVSAETWTDAAHGTRLYFYTADIGGTGYGLNMMLKDNGGLVVGSIEYNYIYNSFGIASSWTSGGGSTMAEWLEIGGTLTGAEDDESYLIGTNFDTSITTQNSADDVVAIIAQVMINEPNITLQGSTTCTIAASLYVADAPSEGGSNYAIYVASGGCDLGASVEADAYTVGGVAGVDFSGAITNLTVVKGIVTAAS